MQARFRDRLQRELEHRREKNPRYSLRAFATLLEADHSTLSQILRDQRRIPVGRLRLWGRKLGLDVEEIAAYVAAEHLPDPATVARNNQIRHWTAEAMAVLTEPCHWQLFHASTLPEFQSDSRWIARQIGVTIDEVNVAFTRLLRLGLMTTDAQRRWKSVGAITTGRAFRREALARVRRQAAELRVELPPPLRRRF